MEIAKQTPIVTLPPRRHIKIFAKDPMAGRTAGNRVTIDIPNEYLSPGPMGERIAVIDYDGVHKCFYPPIDLDEKALLMQNGLDPAESDPRFHQQMVYAVSMKTLENFDRALGRKIYLGSAEEGRLRLFPHAFHGANAYYDSDLNAIMFGYFLADMENPGPNLPGQTVFSCLSHDIIAHEMSHAIAHKLRRYFLEPSNEDVLAFNEGFADIIALLQHFSFPEILREAIQKSQTDLKKDIEFVALAKQFGFATGLGKELRSALGEANPKLYATEMEPHARGSVLVSAVFDGFFMTYQKRIKDLLRIATGGSGIIPAGELHPDLVNRISNEASMSAQATLNMCIRAFEYLPPVDITFGDYLRALVTADFELVPQDYFGQRAAMIEAFRLRGIYPNNVVSLAEESLLWHEPDEKIPPLPLEIIGKKTVILLRELLLEASQFGKIAVQADTKPQELSEKEAKKRSAERNEFWEVRKELRDELKAYAKRNSKFLCLNQEVPIFPVGFHPVFRVSPNGQLLIELVVQFLQYDSSYKEEFGGIPLRGGTTVVAAADGTIRYAIAKPLPNRRLSEERKREASARVERQREYIAWCDANDLHFAYGIEEYDLRIERLANFAELHLR